MVYGRHEDLEDEPESCGPSPLQFSSSSPLELSSSGNQEEIGTAGSSAGPTMPSTSEGQSQRCQRPGSIRPRKPQQNVFFTQLIAKENEFSLREREIKLQEAAAAREDKLISILDALCNK